MSIRIASLCTPCNNRRFGLTLGIALVALACSDSEDSGPTQQTGGASGNAVGNSGGSSGSGGLSPTTGGMSAGGTPGIGGLPGSGGSGFGGHANIGGTGTGGTGTGGVGTGGLGTGGVGTGGLGTGGLGTGGTSTGGTSTGGVGTGGTSTGGVGTGGTGTGGTGTGGVGTGGGETGGGGNGGDGMGGVTGGGADNGGSSDGGNESGGASAGEGQGGGDAGAGTGGSGEDGRSAGCDTEPGIPSSQYNNGNPISITAAGMQRRYILSVPDNYDSSHAYKLVIAWHQLDGNDKQMYNDNYYGLKPLSDNGTIFVAPNGQKDGSPCSGTGSGDRGCGWPNSSGEDVALGDAVVEEIMQNFCVDTNRLFANGWSYGGSMSFANACNRPLSDSGYVRAIAVYAGAPMSGNCTPSHPVAYYGSHGTGDNVLCYDGGSSGCQVNINGGGVGMAESYANANGCTGWTTPERANNGHVCTDVTGCPDGYPVKFCSFTGGHTAYPDGGWQSQMVWEFFSQF